MEHILVITPRQLKDIIFCMEYTHNYNHGADGHNRMNTMTAMAEFIGFYWNEEGNTVEIPNTVRVEDNPTSTPR